MLNDKYGKMFCLSLPLSIYLSRSCIRMALY